MVTWHINRPMSVTMEDGKAKSVDYREGDCLSTDTKPTEGIYNGSIIRFSLFTFERPWRDKI